MHENPLHADAALPRLIKGAERDSIHDIIEFHALIAVDDGSGIAAQLQNDLLFPLP